MVNWTSGSREEVKNMEGKNPEKQADVRQQVIRNVIWINPLKWTRNDTCTCKEIYNNKISANVIFTLVRLVNSL